jgi:hypothetical protein
MINTRVQYAHEHAYVHSAEGDVIYVHGGFDGVQHLEDTYRLDMRRCTCVGGVRMSDIVDMPLSSYVCGPMCVCVHVYMNGIYALRTQVGCES